MVCHGVEWDFGALVWSSMPQTSLLLGHHCRGSVWWLSYAWVPKQTVSHFQHQNQLLVVWTHPNNLLVISTNPFCMVQTKKTLETPASNRCDNLHLQLAASNYSPFEGSKRCSTVFLDIFPPTNTGHDGWWNGVAKSNSAIPGWLKTNEKHMDVPSRTTWGKEHLEIWRYMNGHSHMRFSKRDGTNSFHGTYSFQLLLDLVEWLKGTNTWKPDIIRLRTAQISTVSCLRVCPETYDLWYQTMPMIATTS